MTKKILLFTFLFFSFWFNSSFASVDEATSSVSSIVIDRFDVYNIKYEEGDIIKGYITLVNYENFIVPNVSYSISLTSPYNKFNPSVTTSYDTKFSDQIMSLNPLESKDIDFEYKIPSNYIGNFQLNMNVYAGSVLNQVGGGGLGVEITKKIKVDEKITTSQYSNIIFSGYFLVVILVLIIVYVSYRKRKNI